VENEKEPRVQVGEDIGSWNVGRKRPELRSNALDEIAQLETRERAVELPTEHSYHWGIRTIYTEDILHRNDI
jgi:hypothetical protein